MGAEQLSDNRFGANSALKVYIKSFNRAKDLKSKDITYNRVLSDKLLVANAVKRGVTYALFNEIRTNSPFDDKQWAQFLNINLRTLQRYKESGDYIFKPLQSERIFELAEIVSKGKEVFDSQEYFYIWLKTPSLALEDNIPISLLDSSYGKELVLAELNRIEYGIFI